MTLADFENVELFKSITEASPCAIILINNRGEIIYFNKFAEQLFQYSREEIIGEVVEILIPEPISISHIDKRQKYSMKPEARHMGMGRDLKAIRKDGTQFHAEIGLTPIDINNEKFILATVLNISIRKKYEEEVRLRNKQLVELSYQLTKANDQLETRNKNITDSIEYARKIQQSILPEQSDLKMSFKDFALFYAPKDIIGGDIYWFKKINGIKYCALIDCTGHGVPGAMLSIVVFTILNEICEDMPSAQSGELLEVLHSKLYEFLQQKKGEEFSQDGCDISLCKIYNDKRQIEYSGAWQNLYLYDGNDLQVIKGNPKHIGGYSLLGEPEPTREFTTHKIELAGTTLLAMATDGVVDQLNKDDKAFGNKRLIEMITSSFNKSQSEAEEDISNTLNEWKKDSDQLDDMLYLSFKL